MGLYALIHVSEERMDGMRGNEIDPYLIDEDDLGRPAVLRALRRQNAHGPVSKW